MSFKLMCFRFISSKKIIIVSLVLLLASSSFFLPRYLTSTILSGDFSHQQLQFSLEHGNIEALLFALEAASLYSERWLYLAKKLAKTQGDISFQLAKYNESKNKFKQAIIWYKQAIRLEHSASYIALAQLYFNQLKLLKSQQILDSLFQFNAEHSFALTIELSKIKSLENAQAVILSIKIAIHQGNSEDITRYVDNNVVLLEGSEEGRLLLDDLKIFKIQKGNDVDDIESFYNGNVCPISLQLFATNLRDLKQIQTLIQNFETQPLTNFVCLSTPRYISQAKLLCKGTQNSAIQCDESQWQTLASTINSRYIGVMLPKGGANVHLGILYFDAQDNIDVFSHEVSHLLGFVDEYPLSAKHITCGRTKNTAFSHNIVILNKTYQGERAVIRAKILSQIPWAKAIKTTTPVLQVSLHKKRLNWILGTPKKYRNEVGVFLAKTCDKNVMLETLGIQAYQPLGISTQLQYFEKKFPDEYIDMLRKQLRQFLMPSFHYNIALALFQQGEIKKANDWLKQSADREKLIKRKSKILQGDF